MMPIISVVIPAYNASSFLEESVTSALDQTLSAIEVIIVDDGSTDSTLKIARQLASLDDRVRVYSKQNEGVEKTRNLGIEKASSEWIAFLDADDRWLKSKLELQMAFLQSNPSVSAVSTYGRYFSERKGVFGVLQYGPVSDDEYHDLIALGNPVWLLTSSVLCRRDILLNLGGFDASFMGAAEDLDMWTRIAENVPVQTVPKHLVEFRISSGSASMEKFNIIQENTIRVRINAKRRKEGMPALSKQEFDIWLKGIDQKTIKKWHKEWRASFLYRVAGDCYLQSRYASFAKNLGHSFVISPRVSLSKLGKQVFSSVI